MLVLVNLCGGIVTDSFSGSHDCGFPKTPDISKGAANVAPGKQRIYEDATKVVPGQTC
jgi:hypothetical protein